MRQLLLALCLLPGLAVAGPRADALAEEAEQQYIEGSYIGARTDAEEALSLDPEVLANASPKLLYRTGLR